VQLPQPPVHVGGSSSAALRRVARSGQGWYAFDLSPDQLRERLVDLDGALDAVGRTRADVVISVCPYREAPSPSLVAAYAAAGADRVIVMAGGTDEAELERTLDRLQPLTEVLLDAA